ncbi:MAG: rod shape-determining protein MreC, partial [Chromatiales bacterium]|nr:rod shape-determining protein MreC [Chromatiales bacterium]
MSIAMMTIDHRQHHLGAIRDVLGLAVYPIQSLVNLPNAAGNWVSESVTTRRELEEENRDLHAQQLFLQSQLLKLDALEAENDRLRSLLDAASTIGQPVLV